MSSPTNRVSSRASLFDTARVVTRVVFPTLATGVIARRPRIMALADKLDLDRSAIRLLQRLSARYGAGPVRLRIPRRSIAVVLAATDVAEILRHSADNFTPANWEKRAALSHFQPRGVLISRGRDRQTRRQFHENVLESDQQLHDLADRITHVAEQEADELLAQTRRSRHLDWSRFASAWWRTVRRVVLGDQARDDGALIQLLNELRSDANWAFLRPKRARRHQEFTRHLDAHLRRAESGCLAGAIAESGHDDVDATEQVPHWLFAFDAAGMIAFHALALLATHPEQVKHVYAELSSRDSRQPALLPYLRSCVLESVRLWPTTPALLRDSVHAGERDEYDFPTGTGYFIYTPLFHRAAKTAPHPDSFAPQDWLDGTATNTSGLVPFSDGPGRCPGRNLVLLVTSTVLAALLQRQRVHLPDTRELHPSKPLPSTLDNFRLTFQTTENH